MQAISCEFGSSIIAHAELNSTFIWNSYQTGLNPACFYKDIQFRNTKLANNFGPQFDFSQSNLATNILDIAWMAIIDTAITDGDHDTKVEAVGVNLPSNTFHVKQVSFYTYNNTNLAFNITKNFPDYYYSNINAISMSGISWYDSNLRLMFPQYSSIKIVDIDNSFRGVGVNSVTFTYGFIHLNKQSCIFDMEKYHGYTCLPSVNLKEYHIENAESPYDPYLLNEADYPGLSFYLYFKYPPIMIVPLIAGFKYTLLTVAYYHTYPYMDGIITIRNATGWGDTDPMIQLNIINRLHFFRPRIYVDWQIVTQQNAMWDSNTMNSLLNGDYFWNQNFYGDSSIILNGKRGNTIRFEFKEIDEPPKNPPPNNPPPKNPPPKNPPPKNPTPDPGNQNNPGNNDTLNPPSTPPQNRKPRIIVALTTYAQNRWSSKTLWPDETFPQDGDYVIIPAEVAVKLDINPPRLDTLIVQGWLTIDNEQSVDMEMNFGQIIVTGFFIAGTIEVPLTRNLIIDLSRRIDNIFPILEERSLCGDFYNCFAVKGTLSIVVQAPLITKYNIINKRPHEIVLDGMIRSDWRNGDEIVIGPSGFDPSEIQTAKIRAQDYTTLKINSELFYELRFRDIIMDPITNDNLMVATEVALLSRKITVKSNNSAKLYIASKDQNSFCSLIGVKFQSFEVEFNNFAANKKTVINRNVFTKNAGERALVLRSGDGYQVTDNLFVLVSGTAFSLSGAIANTEVQDNLFIGTQDGLSIGAEFVDSEISSNIITGATGSSVIIRGVKCSNSKIKLNYAHSGNTGLDAYENIDDNCYDSSVFFFGNLLQNGAKFTTYGNQLTIKRLALIGCKNGIIPKCTTPDTMQTLITQNYIRAYSENQRDRSDFKAIEIPSTNDAKGDHVWTTDFQIIGNTFENYNIYSVRYYKYNRILKVPFSSYEGTDIATFGLNTMINCDNSSVFVLPSEDIYSSPNCGGWACTGLSNLIIRDPIGTLFGKTSTILPMNSALVADDNTCVLNDLDRGYVCPNQNWALLAFESQDGDRYSRLITPIYVKSSAGGINKINSHGKHTQGLRRLSRFWSVLQVNRSYTIEYTADLPKKFHFQLQGAASPYDWVIIKQRYTVSQIINVDVKGVPGPTLVDQENLVFTSADPCGTSIYSGVNQTVEFKLTGASDCDVVLKATRSMKGKVRYAMSIEDFFKKDGPTAFADNVALVLEIDLSRIRVVSVVKGSVIIEFHILSLEANATVSTDIEDGPNGEPGNVTNQEQTHLAELEALSAKWLTAMSSTQMNLFNAAVLDYEFGLVSSRREFPDSIKSESSNLLAFTIIGIIGLLIVGTLVLLCRKKKLRNAKIRIKPYESGTERGLNMTALSNSTSIILDKTIIQNVQVVRILPKMKEMIESKEEIQSKSTKEIQTKADLIKDSAKCNEIQIEVGAKIDSDQIIEKGDQVAAILNISKDNLEIENYTINMSIKQNT